jgi:hypothetical protein
VTVSLFATTMTLPLGPHGTYVAWESYGVVASDTGEGLFHGATNRCVGAFFSAQGTVEGEGYSDSVIAGKLSPCLPISGSPHLAFRRCGGEFAT